MSPSSILSSIMAGNYSTEQLATRRTRFEAIWPASIISSTVDLRNLLTYSVVTLEWFGSTLPLVPFLLMSTAAVNANGLGQQSNLQSLISQQRLAGSMRQHILAYP
jgi:hypothetical protein